MSVFSLEGMLRKTFLECSLVLYKLLMCVETSDPGEFYLRPSTSGPSPAPLRLFKPKEKQSCGFVCSDSTVPFALVSLWPSLPGSCSPWALPSSPWPMFILTNHNHTHTRPSRPHTAREMKVMDRPFLRLLNAEALRRASVQTLQSRGNWALFLTVHWSSGSHQKSSRRLLGPPGHRARDPNTMF